MAEKPLLGSQVGSRAKRGLVKALKAYRDRDGVRVEKGYVKDFKDNLLRKYVHPSDFEDELRAGKGDELGEKGKFRAAYSSSALAVNCFAPFRNQSRIADLIMPNNTGGGFNSLEFERKCPVSGVSGTPPHLDVVLYGSGTVIGIESKLTEYLKTPNVNFSPKYKEKITDARREQGYFREMIRLMDNYKWLNAPQLIKHAFGLCDEFPDRSVTLLYLYWEPENADDFPLFKEHRQEIEMFSERVADATPTFKAMSYLKLWDEWRTNANADWVSEHLCDLESRYRITIPYEKRL